METNENTEQIISTQTSEITQPIKTNKINDDIEGITITEKVTSVYTSDNKIDDSSEKIKNAQTNENTEIITNQNMIYLQMLKSLKIYSQ